MLHLTPATLQGHTVGEEIKGLFLSILFYFFLFVCLIGFWGLFCFGLVLFGLVFFPLKRKTGKAGLMETGNWWSCLQVTFGCFLYSNQSGKLEATHEQTSVTEEFGNETKAY